MIGPVALGLLSSLFTVQLSAMEIIIEERETGFCAVDGEVLSSVEGYTGKGYADTDIAAKNSVSWSVNAEEAGTVGLIWRYGNGGGDRGDRPGRLVINGGALGSVSFPHTGTWSNWTQSDTTWVELDLGYNSIRLEALSASGLGNIDYLKVFGKGLSPSPCQPIYVLKIGQSHPLGGAVSYEPVLEYYEAETLVTLRAQANPGFFFQSWSGNKPSTDPAFEFAIDRNIELTAIFLPDGTNADPELIGYATVQDDRGTPYLVTGGALGDTVAATTLKELRDYLARSEPYIVTFSGQVQGAAEIEITSNKTLLGLGPQAHLKGIGLVINRARNVIVRNMQISHVTPQDAIEINNRSQNIWIDRCQLFSDRAHHKDFYDGLLDIKNESSFITISRSVFRDHFKTSLISSGDQAVADSVIRVTYHHNHFYNCESRLPSIRFGKAHIFNNYYQNSKTAINSRMGACVRVENNYFENVGTAVMMEFSPQPGGVELIGNHFGASRFSTSPACGLEVPYIYETVLDRAEDLPVRFAASTLVEETQRVPLTYYLTNFPNPFNSTTHIAFALPNTETVTLEIFSLGGQRLATLIDQKRLSPGIYQVPWDASENASGIYLCRLRTAQYRETRKMVLQN